MPNPGLSLVGFMSQAEAIAHLQNACIPENPDPHVLTTEWRKAKARIGGPDPRAGHPDIKRISSVFDEHVSTILGHPVVTQDINARQTTCEMVEIDPLLTYQHAVDMDRVAHHCSGLSSPPTEHELVELSLPLVMPQEDIRTTSGVNSYLIRARSLNVRAFTAGLLTPDSVGQLIGMQFGVSLPYTHVVRYNGKCYLHNGVHRAVGARSAGATHMPCLFTDILRLEDIGLREGTFSPRIMEADNPPTIAHYTQGHAHPVALRAHSRVLHVSWAEYNVPDE